MNEQEIELLLLFLKALSDKTRLRIMGLIATRERSVDEIADLLELKPPTVSHHLAKLRECGLVSMRSEGTIHNYSLDEGRLSALLRDLSPKAIKEVAEDVDTTAYDRKVVNTFIVNGRLIEIPAQRKKREVILRQLVTEFAVDRRYSEKEINETLKRFHEDVATLRREFIMCKMMEREDNVYWRIGD